MTDQANGANGNVKQRAAIWVFAVFILGRSFGECFRLSLF